MQPILNALEMKQYEKNTIDLIGLPSLVLMERAGLFATSACLDLCPDKVLVLCGPGNNGGDGLCVARLLALKGIKVDVILAGDRDKATRENIIQLHILEKITNIAFVNSVNHNASYDIIVDGLFGISLSRPLAGDFLSLTTNVNEYRKNNKCTVISLDCPSGLNASDGIVFNECIIADITVCFGFIKQGLYLNKGKIYSGKILLDDVGIVDIKDSLASNYIEQDDLKQLFIRSPLGNKSSFGKSLIIAGSFGMPGAAYLATRSCLKCGAGMVKLLTNDLNFELLLNTIPEVLACSFSNMNSDELLHNFDWCDNVLIGPGLSLDDKARELVLYTIYNCSKPVIFDADALTILSENMDCILERKKKGYITIVTPHPGEFCRLFGCKISDLFHQNIKFIKEMANKYGMIIVAKDATTIVASDNEVYINLSGNEGMGCAGSGDVLSGMITAITSKSDDLCTQCALAVYLHGLCGDFAKNEFGALNMTAADIINQISKIDKQVV